MTIEEALYINQHSFLVDSNGELDAEHITAQDVAIDALVVFNKYDKMKNCMNCKHHSLDREYGLYNVLCNYRSCNPDEYCEHWCEVE